MPIRIFGLVSNSSNHPLLIRCGFKFNGEIDITQFIFTPSVYSLIFQWILFLLFHSITKNINDCLYEKNYLVIKNLPNTSKLNLEFRIWPFRCLFKHSNRQTEPYFFKIFYLQQSETTKVNLHRKWLRTAMLVDFFRFNYIFTFNSTFLPQFSNSAFFLSILLFRLDKDFYPALKCSKRENKGLWDKTLSFLKWLL